MDRLLSAVSEVGATYGLQLHWGRLQQVIKREMRGFIALFRQIRHCTEDGDDILGPYCFERRTGPQRVGLAGGTSAVNPLRAGPIMEALISWLEETTPFH